jgi:hypothetical protein
MKSYNVLKGNHKFTEDDIKDETLLDVMVNSLDVGSDISMIPGLIDIPNCGWDEIKDNWSKGLAKTNKNYPCNP